MPTVKRKKLRETPRSSFAFPAVPTAKNAATAQIGLKFINLPSSFVFIIRYRFLSIVAYSARLFRRSFSIQRRFFADFPADFPTDFPPDNIVDLSDKTVAIVRHVCYNITVPAVYEVGSNVIHKYKKGADVFSDMQSLGFMS